MVFDGYDRSCINCREEIIGNGLSNYCEPCGKHWVQHGSHRWVPEPEPLHS